MQRNRTGRRQQQKCGCQQQSALAPPHVTRAPVEKRLNRLVFIGRNLDRQRLNASFRACLVAARAA